MTGPWATTTLCLLAVAGLLVAEWRQAPAARALLKTLASLAFVGVALQLQALGSGYGLWVLAALVLGLLGDVLLLCERSRFFLGGLAAFLASHLAYALGFVAAGVAPQATAIGLALALGLGALVLRRLWPHLGAAYRLPVLAYVLAILAMCALAGGHAVQAGRPAILAGALLFAASDLAVARQRFIAPGFVNKAWGLPTYYLAQLLLAWSVVVKPGT